MNVVARAEQKPWLVNIHLVAASLPQHESSAHSVAAVPKDAQTLYAERPAACMPAMTHDSSIKCSSISFEHIECAQAHLWPFFNYDGQRMLKLQDVNRS